MNFLSRPATYGDCVRLGLGTRDRLCPHVACGYHTGSDALLRGTS